MVTRSRAIKPFTLVNPRGQMHVIGMRRAVLTDLYYYFIQKPWSVLFGSVAVLFFILNLLFAELFQLTGGVAHARPDCFLDYFFFSVQSMATIGFGYMYPDSLAAHLLVTFEAVLGLLGFALIAGLVFSKFSRPRARVIFSRLAVVTPYDGVPTLMFRVANERANFIADATLQVAIVRPKVTLEGRTFSRVEELPLVLKSSPMFFLTWTAMHRITPDSPLHGLDAAALAGKPFVIVCSLSGFDSTVGQTIHARFSYGSESLVWGARLKDILHINEDGRGTTIDYNHFHSTEADT